MSKNWNSGQGNLIRRRLQQIGMGAGIIAVIAGLIVFIVIPASNWAEEKKNDIVNEHFCTATVRVDGEIIEGREYKTDSGRVIRVNRGNGLEEWYRETPSGGVEYSVTIHGNVTESGTPGHKRMPAVYEDCKS